MGQPVAEIERLILAGHADEAWNLVLSGLTEGPADDRLEESLVHGVFLAIAFQDQAWIDSWLDVFARAAERSAREDWPHLISALRVAKLWSVNEYDAAGEIAATVDWQLVGDRRPWAQTLRLYVLCYEDRVREAIELMRRWPLRDLEKPYDIGGRLTFLMWLYQSRQQPRRCIELGRAALAQLARAPGLVSRVREIQALARLGGIHSELGQVDAAVSCFERLFATAKRLRLLSFLGMYCEVFALLYVDRGQFAKAADVLAGVPLPASPSSPREVIQHAKRHLCHAQIHLEAEDPRRAFCHVYRAFDFLKRHGHRRHYGNACLLLGRVLGLTGRRHLRDAFAALERAETVFRKLGCIGTQGLVATLTCRGELFLKQKDVAAALDCFAQSVEITRLEDLPVQSRSLLLKSHLLVAGAFDEDDDGIYEEILRELGVVRSRALLFRVLANLYVFSWRLGHKDNDLTRNHLTQLTSMRQILDDDVYCRFYNRYVRNPVGRRTCRKFFGCEPWELMDDMPPPDEG